MMFKFNRAQALIAAIIIFICVQAIGLWTASEYLGYINAGIVEPAFENPQEVMNAVYMMLYILGVTALILLVIKFKRSLIVVLEAVAIFFASGFVFSLFAPFPFEIILALLLTMWKLFYPTHLSQNITMTIAVAGAGAVIGVSFAVLPVIAFMLMLSVYDFIAVFITKHMVYMAKAITERPTAFTAAFPVKIKKYKHTFQLGGGDLVFPLILSAATLNYHGWFSALFVAAGGLIALVMLFSYVLKKPGTALPALPPVCAGSCIGLFASLILF